MRTLPDNPNLDHLRQQAKELLAGLRDSDPSASLAAAQACLADQYGFRGWPALRAEVHRLRDRATMAEPALAQAVADRFGLGTVTGPMRSLARADDMGRRWSLPTDQGTWAVRTMDTWWPIVDAETDVALQEAASAAGVLLPRPVRSRSGEVMVSVGGHTWRAYQWRHSGPPLVAPVSAATARQVGVILARVHQLALPVDRISPWHAVRFSTATWAELSATATAKAMAWAPALVAVEPVLTELDTLVDGEPEQAPVLCHNTLGPANVRRGPDGSLIVFDWEHAGGQPPAWEIGDVLMGWTINPGGEVNAAAVRALIDGYRSEAGGVPPLGLSMFSGAVVSLANYVAGQIDQALTAGGEQDQRYAERSVVHLLSHLPTQHRLRQLLAAARAA